MGHDPENDWQCNWITLARVKSAWKSHTQPLNSILKTNNAVVLALSRSETFSRGHSTLQLHEEVKAMVIWSFVTLFRRQQQNGPAQRKKLQFPFYFLLPPDSAINIFTKENILCVVFILTLDKEQVGWLKTHNLFSKA